MLELLAFHWGVEAGANDRYFQWKYEQNPYLDQVLIYLAMAGDELVGMRGVFGASWIDPTGADARALCAGDLVIRPRDRNRFLPRRIMAAMADDLTGRGYRYLLGFSASRFTHLLSLRQGWTLAVEHAQARRPPRPTPFARVAARLRGFGGGEPAPFAAFDRAAAAKSGRRPAAITVEHASRAEEMSDLCARSRQRLDGFQPVRDERFFEWRFRNPAASSRFLFWREASALAAYLVLAQRPGDDARIRMVDWAFASREAMARLVGTAVELGRSSRILVWLGGRSEDERALFERAGFVVDPFPEGERHRPGLLIESLRADHPSRQEETTARYHQAWRYHMVDADGF